MDAEIETENLQLTAQKSRIFTGTLENFLRAMNDIRGMDFVDYPFFPEETQFPNGRVIKLFEEKRKNRFTDTFLLASTTKKDVHNRGAKYVGPAAYMFSSTLLERDTLSITEFGYENLWDERGFFDLSLSDHLNELARTDILRKVKSATESKEHRYAIQNLKGFMIDYQYLGR